MRLIDRTGDRYARLTVVERLPAKSSRDTNARWFCRCDCGRATVAYGGDLERGKVKSCGCLNAERIMQHGMSNTHVYAVWQAMLQRCENPKAQRYEIYGGRGISVCESWHRFENFYADMGVRPKGYSLDRIDVHKGYCKENCRWATTVQQANNKQRNRIVEFKGEKKTLAEWAETIGIGWYTLRSRLDNYGWDVERAFTERVHSDVLHTFRGRSKTLPAWCEEFGQSYDLVKARLSKLNWSLEDALMCPAGPKNSHQKAN